MAKPIQYCKVKIIIMIIIIKFKKNSPSLQQYVNQELPDVRTGFRKS